MSVKVELGFTDAGVGAPFFTIGDATKGVIGNSSFVIGGGEALVDVTAYLRTVSMRRGKNRELNRFDAGQLVLAFNNNLRFFDPTYASSPFYGQIVPKRRVRYSVDNSVQFDGVVDDWNISYSPGGFSVANAVAVDATSQLANLSLESFAPDMELSGTRINNALDNVLWPADLRDIDAGQMMLEDQIVTSGTNLLEYLNVVQESEPGSLFISKDGKVKFVDRTGGYSVSPTTFADDGSGIEYQAIEVVYGSELLYNKITVTSALDTFTAEDTLSQALYGIRDLTINTYIANADDVERLANYYLGKFKQPEYRIEKISVNLDAVSPSERAAILALDLGDVVEILFTPSNIPPQVSKAGKVISIEQDADPGKAIISFGFESMDGVPFIIGSSEFGIIGTGLIGF